MLVGLTVAPLPISGLRIQTPTTRTAPQTSVRVQPATGTDRMPRIWPTRNGERGSTIKTRNRKIAGRPTLTPFHAAPWGRYATPYENDRPRIREPRNVSG